MFKKGDKVIVTPVSYPTVKWLGEIISTRNTKYGIKYKVSYDCGGMMLADSFSEKELNNV